MPVARQEFEANVKITIIKSGKTEVTEEQMAAAVIEVEQELNNMQLQPTKTVKKYFQIYLGKEKKSDGNNQDKDLA